MPSSTTASRPGNVPGEEAEKPQEIPARGWLQIVKRGWAEAKADNVPLLAAGVAFYTFLAIFPAMVAVVLVYGLISDAGQISAQVNGLGAVPDAAKELLTSFLTSLTAQPGKTGFSLVVAIALALWSASGGMNNLMTAVNIAYDEQPKRSFLKQRGLALLLTFGAIVLMVIMLGLIAVLPRVLALIDLGVLNVVFQVLRWVVAAALITVALAVLYRVAPDRDAPKMRWVSVGAGAASFLFLLASVGFSIYAGFGGYSKTYGAFAGIVVLLFWLWITCYAVLLGAEINAESEQQTVADTTKGPSEPIGQRNAVKADSLPEEAERGDGASRQTTSTKPSSSGPSRPGGGPATNAGAKAPHAGRRAALEEDMAATRQRLDGSMIALGTTVNPRRRLRAGVGRMVRRLRHR